MKNVRGMPMLVSKRRNVGFRDSAGLLELPPEQERACQGAFHWIEKIVNQLIYEHSR